MQNVICNMLWFGGETGAGGRWKQNMMLNVAADVLILLLLVFAFLDASAAFDRWAFRAVYKTSTATQSKTFQHTERNQKQPTITRLKQADDGLVM